MEITCQVCSMQYCNDEVSRIPRNLSCGHSFCSGCLTKLVRGGIISCPFRCAAKTIVSEGVENLPKAFGILDILKSREALSSSSTVSSSASFNSNFRTHPHIASPPMIDPRAAQPHYPSAPGRASHQDNRAPPYPSDNRPPPFNPAAASVGSVDCNPAYPVPPYPMHQVPPMPNLPPLGNLPPYPAAYPPYPSTATPPYPNTAAPSTNPPYPSMMASMNPPYPSVAPNFATNMQIPSSRSSADYSNSPRSRSPTGGNFHVIKDNYRTLEEVQQALRRAGLESSNLIIAIDYTKSNTWTGEHAFQGRCLHWIDPTGRELNPYQSVCMVIGRTLQSFDDDNLIPAFGFGDRTTGDRGCFPFYPDGSLCVGIEGVVSRYNEITSSIVLAGPTNFAPVIREAIKITAESRSYHILVIVADGQVTSKRDTENAIVEASRYPLSIIVVGVGDGPWDVMEEFDDGLPERSFDNFQFVDYHAVEKKNLGPGFDAAFATAALMEIPEQYQAIKDLELL